MAFYKSQLRDALLPNAVYRQIWQDITVSLPAREASRLMVGLLHLAATADYCEDALGEIVTASLLAGKLPCLADLKKRWGIVQKPYCPIINVKQHPLESYNQLVPVGKGGSYDIY